MLCPLCQFDNSEMGLREGRCSQCGSVLQWDDSVGDVSPELREAIASQAARIAPLDGASPGADSEDLRRVADALKANQDARLDSPAPPRGPALAVDERHVTRQWQPGLTTDARPMQTIKGVSTSSVSDMPLFIHPRAVRRPGDPEFGPAEYELLDMIGEGGVGVVYSARQSSIDRNVAVKMVKAGTPTDDATRDKFLAEAIVTGDLDHPNIVPVYDLGKDSEGALFYAMKRVVGIPWSHAMFEKPQSENLEILMKVADAIAFAHARGVVHRDIKPENVMLGEFGEVLVMDWGIALPMSTYRKSGGVLLSQGLGGTPAYMAPEMATGPLSMIGYTSDVYLLGAVLYEIVTGNPPHRGADVMSCVLAAAKNDVSPTDKTGELVDIALRAMATDPEDRYRSVLEFQAAVRNYQSHVESVTLCERAHKQLEEARESGSYDDYARSVFAYEEAIALWSGNDPARVGRSAARLAFAECAWNKGDYDLGLSQADRADPSHLDVIERLERSSRLRTARESTFRNLRAVLLLLAVIVFVGGAVFTKYIYDSRAEAERLAEEAESKRKEAVAAQEKASTAESEAVKAKGDAEKQRGEAEKSREVAVAARDDAERNQDTAEEEQYFAEVGLVNERIAGNAFDVARQVLNLHSTSAKSRLRHWEWSRLRFLCDGGLAGQNQVQAQATEWPVEAFAVSDDGRIVVVGGAEGQVRVWSIGDAQRKAEFSAEHELHAIALNGDGTLIATAGGDERIKNGGVVKVWRLNASQGAELLAEWTGKSPQLQAVDFSPRGDRLVAGGLSGSAFVWNWESKLPASAAATRLLEGHENSVWDAVFSASGDRVATAGEDKTVRIWDPATGVERQRFRGHSGPVYAVTFANSGRRLASAGYDQRILVWPLDEDDSLPKRLKAELDQAIAGKPTPARIDKELTGHTASIHAVQFSADESRLVSGGEDNTVRVWTLSEPVSNNARPAAKDSNSTAPAGKRPATVVLRGHGGWVRGCALLDPAVTGGKLLAVSGAMDRSWRRWDVEAYEESRLLFEPQAMVRDAVFTPDGRGAIAALEDGVLTVWDAEQRQVVNSLREGHEFLVASAFVSPDRSRLFTAAGDNSLRIWNLRNGVELKVLQPIGHRGLAAPSPDAKFVLTGGANKSVKWWDTSTGEIVHRFEPEGGAVGPAPSSVEFAAYRERLAEVTAVAVSPDGTLLFAGDDKGFCRVWEASTGKRLHSWSAHEFALTAAAFVPRQVDRASRGAPASLLLVTTSTDQLARVWEVTRSGSRAVASLQHAGPVWSLAIAPDGRRVATTSSVRDPNATTQDKTTALWLWSLENYQTLAKQPLTLPSADGKPARKVSVNSLTWSAEESNRILVSLTDQANSRQELWQWSPGESRLEPRSVPRGARGTMWTALPIDGGRQLLTAGGKGAKLWEASQTRPAMTFKSQDKINRLAIHPNGKWLVAAGSDGSAALAKVWKLPESLAEMSHAHTLAGDAGRTFTSAVFAPNDEILTGDDAGQILQWDLASSERPKAKEFARVPSAVRDLRFTPDFRRLVAACDDGKIRVWELATEKQSELAGHSGPVRAIVISSDSRWVLSGGDDRLARVWELATGRELAQLSGHSAPIDAVALSADGLRALTGSRDGTAKLWNLMPLARRKDHEVPAENSLLSAKEVLTVARHDREVTAVAFSPNGQHLLTASADGKAQLWYGEALPPALELDAGGIDYLRGGPAQTLDEQAVVIHPSPRPDERLSLVLRFATERSGETIRSAPDDRLFVSARPTPVGLIDVQDGKVLHREAESKPSRSIANVSWSDAERQLTIDFEPSVPSWLVQAVARSVVFENRNSNAELFVRTITGELRSSAIPSTGAPLELRTVQLRVEDLVGN